MGAVKSVRKMGKYKPKQKNEIRLSSYLKEKETDKSTNIKNKK